MSLYCHFISQLISLKPRVMLPIREMGTCLFQQPKAHPISQWRTSYLGSFLNINQIGKEGLIDCNYFQIKFFKILFLLLA
jgi:hypothetical protein